MREKPRSGVYSMPRGDLTFAIYEQATGLCNTSDSCRRTKPMWWSMCRCSAFPSTCARATTFVMERQLGHAVAQAIADTARIGTALALRLG